MAKDFKYINMFNRFISNIVNNRLSNRIKELFVTYPLFLYSEITNDYIAEFILNPESKIDAQVTIVNTPSAAKPYPELWWFQKKAIAERELLLKQVNKSFEKDPEKRVFRFKRILVYTSTAGK